MWRFWLEHLGELVSWLADVSPVVGAGVKEVRLRVGSCIRIEKTLT